MNNQKFWKEFILLYKNLPALWDTLSLHYRERGAKIEACDLMLEKLREFDPAATRCDVMRKINIFRTNYRRECARINLSRQEGRVYHTTLWYYNLLTFLENHNIPRRGKRHILDNADVNAQKIMRRKSSAPPDSTGQPMTYSTRCHYVQKINRRKSPMESKDYLMSENDYVVINRDDNIDYSNNACEVSEDFSDEVGMKEISEIIDENDMEQQYFGTNTDTMSRDDADDESAIYDDVCSYIAEDESPMQSVKSEMPEHGGESQSQWLKCEQQNKHITSSSKKFKVQQMRAATTNERQTSSAAEILAKSWAIQYDEMSDNQKIFARKAIADILFQGCLGNLGFKKSTSPKRNQTASTTFEEIVENRCIDVAQTSFYDNNDDGGQSHLNDWVVGLK